MTSTKKETLEKIVSDLCLELFDIARVWESRSELCSKKATAALEANKKNRANFNHGIGFGFDICSEDLKRVAAELSKRLHLAKQKPIKRVKK